MAFRKGYLAEMELLNWLRQRKYYAVRVPVSGGRGFPCDILAAKDGDRRAYEVKATREKALYLYEEDLKPFIEFCRRLGFQAYVAVRWKYKKKNPWTFVQVNEIRPIKISRK